MTMKLWRLIARVVVGSLFIGHGTQKLFGWFGGHGPEGTGKFFESRGIRPGRHAAIAAGAAEAGGGAMLALGLLTPLAGAALSSVMITAIRQVHGSKGPWSSQGGYEYNLVLLAAIFGLVEEGAGRLSLDSLLGTERSGVMLAIGQLALGAAGSAAVLELGRRFEHERQAAEPQEQPQAAPLAVAA
jgi:putative oxidoreductase